MYQMKPVTEKLNIYIGFFVVSGVFGKFIWREIGGEGYVGYCRHNTKKGVLYIIYKMILI